MKRSTRSGTRALTKFECTAGTRSVSTTYSMKSAKFPVFHKNKRIKKKSSLDSPLKSHSIVKRKILRKVSLPKRLTTLNTPKSSMVTFKSQVNGKQAAFMCFKEDDMFTFKNGIKNKLKILTEDFDIESDEEMIKSAVKILEKRIAKVLN